MIVALVRDLLFATRIADAAFAAGRPFLRVDDPAQLPPPESVEVIFVDWGDRRAGWGTRLAAWLASSRDGRPRLVLFGPHADLDAHAAARGAGLGPMLARSKLLADLRTLLVPTPPAPPPLNRRSDA